MQQLLVSEFFCNPIVCQMDQQELLDILRDQSL